MVVEKRSSNQLDILKYIAVALLLVAGVAVYYWLAETSNLYAVLACLVAFAAAGFVFFQTNKGGELFGFIKASRAELRKVEWPSKPETIQTTMVVIVLVVIAGAILWLVDFGLSKLFRILVGG